MILCDAYSPALRKAIPGDDQASDDNIVQVIVRHGFLRRGQVRHVVEHEHAGGGQAASPLRRRAPPLVLQHAAVEAHVVPVVAVALVVGSDGGKNVLDESHQVEHIREVQMVFK